MYLTLDVLKLQALDATANGVVITDTMGKVVWANPAVEKLTGYRPDELVGGNPRVLKSGMQDPEMYRVLWETLLRGEVWHGRLVNKRKDGTLYHEEMTITPVRDPDHDDQVRHFVAVKRDVSLQVLAENQRNQLIGRLGRAADQLGDMLIEGVRVLLNISELQAPAIGRHGRRVADLSLELALRMGVSDKIVHPIWAGGALHDLGKCVGPPDSRRSSGGSPGHRFRHAVEGAQLIAPMSAAAGVASIVRHHHERFDGSGYPDGLAGLRIPIGARIVAVASCLDNAVHVARLDANDAMSRIIAQSGTAFDPKVVEALVEISAEHSSSSSQAEDVLIPVSGLRPGMQLSEDLMSASGVLLLPRRRTLSTADYRSLRKYRDAEGPIGFVRVVLERT